MSNRIVLDNGSCAPLYVVRNGSSISLGQRDSEDWLLLSVSALDTLHEKLSEIAEEIRADTRPRGSLAAQAFHRAVETLVALADGEHRAYGVSALDFQILSYEEDVFEYWLLPQNRRFEAVVDQSTILAMDILAMKMAGVPRKDDALALRVPGPLDGYWRASIQPGLASASRLYVHIRRVGD